MSDTQNKCPHRGCKNGVWLAENGNHMDCPHCKKHKLGVHAALREDSNSSSTPKRIYASLAWFPPRSTSGE